MATKTTRTTNQPKKGKTTKKPVARRRVQSAPSDPGRFFRENGRLLFSVFSAIALGVLLFVGYQAATASSVFQTQKIDINGARRSSVPAIETIVKRLTARSGVWNADLDLIRKEIERLSWVKTAVVSRVLPDGLRVRVTERTPAAVVRAENGKLVWVDDEARMLGPVLQNEPLMPFALTGWNEDDTPIARRNNQERVSLYLKLLDEWQKAELANRITAVDLSDLQDVTAFVEKDEQLVSVHLGQTDYATRLRLSLDALEQESQNGKLAQVEKIIAHGRNTIVGYKNIAKTQLGSVRQELRAGKN